MKKVITFIFVFVYFTVSTGFTVNLHYCMDNFQSWELGADEDDSCEKCGMPTSEKGNCCRDEVKVMKLQQDPLQSGSISLPQGFGHFMQAAYLPFTLLPLHNYKVRRQHCAHSPPLLSEVDTYIFIRVFLV
jgi:hypothetical protein